MKDDFIKGIPKETDLPPGLQKEVDNIKKGHASFEEKVDNLAKNSEDVKAGRCTEEDEKQEPELVLFRKITETTLEILQDPEMGACFKLMENKGLNLEIIQALVRMMAIAMSTSAFNAISFYDDLLKEELRKQFNHMGSHINAGKSENEVLRASINVVIAKMGEVTKKLQIEDLKLMNNISDLKSE